MEDLQDLEASPAADSGEEPQPGTGVSVEELLPDTPQTPQPEAVEDARLLAILEALVYVAEEPLTLNQIASALGQPAPRIRSLLERLIGEFEQPSHGITIREVAGGYKMATKPEHHDAVRDFVKSLTPSLKLSLPALETLAMIAYKQPITGPEIQEIRGVQGAGVIKTLLDRKLITAAGRKNVVGKPILYKTTKEFLLQFGLKDLAELPSLKEFEDIRRLAVSDADQPGSEPPVAAPAESAEPGTSGDETPSAEPADLPPASGEES